MPDKTVYLLLQQAGRTLSQWPSAIGQKRPLMVTQKSVLMDEKQHNDYHRRHWDEFGSIPCTLAGVMIIYLMASLEEGRAAGRDVGFDVIGVLMMTFFTYLIALGSCLAGLIYFGLGVRSGSVALKAWQWFCLAYPLGQNTAATIYMAVR